MLYSKTIRFSSLYASLLPLLFIWVAVTSPTVDGQDASPVTIAAKVVPLQNAASRFRVVVEVEIEHGWHAYASVADGNTSRVMEVRMKCPDGVEPAGDWLLPLALPYPAEPDNQVYEGAVKFSREISVQPSGESRDIDVVVSYQVCDEKRCMPPTTSKTKVTIEATKSSEAAIKPFEFSSDSFEAPFRLMVGDSPLNVAAKQMYPSPAMFDVDGDGRVELVVGDIFGSLNVYQNESKSGAGDPVWSKHVGLKTADGAKIKVSNW